MERADDGDDGVRTIKQPFKDFGHYAGWSLLWFGLAGLLTFVPDAGANLRRVLVVQVAAGLAFGLVFAILFTLAQNAFNAARGKPKSWIFAICLWMALKFAIAAVLM